ncbi:MAG: excinuclease ABC subunit UvrC [Gammaproteobacteria bacterium]|nr:excinuclease ABC subunit UvrC [Gammaproteobacteria bacterium]
MSQALQPEFDHRAFLFQLTTAPGVYRMYGAGGELLYVGKARNLKKRVASYFLRASGDPRIETMVAQIRRMEVTVTATEDQALLLEATLIKEQRPRYNIQYRDDKSYPLLRISRDHPPSGPADGSPDPERFPRIGFYRGARVRPHRYFGPFPSAAAVRETVQTLQKLFRLRPCKDSFFANRRRPCLQYQIGRCSAPCVGLIGEADYARDVVRAQRLLEGHGEALARELADEMEAAATALNFEHAARLRDQIAALRRLQESRAISGETGDLDAVAMAAHPTRSCVVVMRVRGGQNLGHASYFPRHPRAVETPALLSAFLGQYYLDWPPPAEVLVPEVPDEADWLAASLSIRAGQRVRIRRPQRGLKLRLLRMAQQNAGQALSAHLAESVTLEQRLEALREALALPCVPRRIECFDVSHTAGERTVASCVVFGEGGPLKNAYRRFNIGGEGLAPGDDYAALRQAVGRRYARAMTGEGVLPDLILIDGGRGQLAAAVEALRELELDRISLTAVAKGPTRRPGLEQLWLPGRAQALMLPPDSPALHLIQQIRDEAHRFAITGHRGRRGKARLESELERIEGLGSVRRRAVLRTLGGLPQVKRAGLEELTAVPGISRKLAERIYARFH